MRTPHEAIALNGIVKTYGPSIALENATFTVAEGRVHALLGENGAGKSTTVKLLSGLVHPNDGEITVFGERVQMRRPSEAHRLGIQTAYQELTLVQDLTVADNVVFPYQPAGVLGQLRRRHAEEQVAQHFAEFDLSDISPRTMVRNLTLPQRQKVEIARALFRKPRILLLDESTSALSGADVEWLSDIVSRQKANGLTIIFITHRMPEVRMFCDELTILRNGATVGSYQLGDLTDDEVVEMIIGRSIDKVFPKVAPPVPSKHPVLDVTNLSAGKAQDVSLQVRRGEILGVAGLQGMGQLDVFRSLFGDLPRTSGTVRLDGNEIRLSSPQDAVKSRIGVNLVPEERKTEALFLKMDGRQNITMPVLDHYARLGLIDKGAEEGAVLNALERVEVAPRALEEPAQAFSGGNQQKIVMAKWLLAGSRVLLLYDPTRGVDIGTKKHIYELIADYAAAGGAVLLYSTEIEEVVHLSHRALVFYNGRVASELDATSGPILETDIMRAALGSSPASLQAAE